MYPYVRPDVIAASFDAMSSPPAYEAVVISLMLPNRRSRLVAFGLSYRLAF